MPRAKSKESLIKNSQDNFESLFYIINELPSKDILREFTFLHREKNIRDVLMHLYYWHKMMLSWYKKGMAGETFLMPAREYTWRQTPELNQILFLKYQNITYEEANELLHASHEKIMILMLKHSEDELFTKKRYSWTGSTSLASYLISSSSSHYSWALKLIKKHKKSIKY